MASDDETGFNAEQLYRQWSKYPAREIFTPPLKVGVLTGATGLLTGGVAAILRSSPTPYLFTIVSGIQCFALGSIFWSSRSILFSQWKSGPSPSLQDRVSASTYAGGITGGTVGALFRGYRNFLPGMVMFTIFGYVGQTVFNRLDERHSEKVAVQRGREEEKKGFWNRVSEMKWSPMKTLSDEEYGNILRDKVLRIEAEIALVDEQVDKLRDEERIMKERSRDTADETKERK